MTTTFTLSNESYIAELLAPLGDLSEGACVGADPRLFDNGRSVTERVSRARRWCDGCPVAQTCLDGAVTRGDSGIWGGRMLVHGRDVTRSRP